MLRKAGVPIEENTKVLPEFFVYRYIIPPETLYKNIYQIPFGSRIGIMLNEEKLKICYLANFKPPREGTSADDNRIGKISDRTLQILNEICGSLEPIKEKTTILLSGGLDSSILFKVIQNRIGVETSASTGYSFENSRINYEKEYALTAARAFGAKHNYFEPSVKEYLLGILRAIAAAEQPLLHLQSVLLYLLFENLPQNDKTIVISGEGADSIFGSELHNSCMKMEKVKWANLLSCYPLLDLIKFMSGITGRGRGYLYRLYRSPDSRAALKDPDNVLWVLNRYGDIDWVQNYFSVSREAIIANRYKALKPFSGYSLFDMIAVLSVLGGASVTQDVWSKLGEANGKFLFYPFTHFELIENTFSVSWKLKLAKPKNILREAGRLLYIPDNIISRPKKGFGINQEHWAQRGAVFEPLVPLMKGCFEEKLIREMQTIEPHRAMIFWSMINYTIWKRLIIDEEPLQLLEDELSESISMNENYG
jgi:asparagine synthetase B (glutamine-hydrolysing)